MYFVLITFFVYFKKKAEDKAKLGVDFFKEGKYKEAITEFTTYLKTELDAGNRKVAHYNRGIAHYKLGHHDNALQDGEECLKIDPFWAKGYKCKGLALEGMGRLTDAMETFLDGDKMCSGHDQNTGAVLHEYIKRLNRVTGFLGEDLDVFDRKQEEKYCAACDMFEKDMGGSLELNGSKKFVTCDKCKMVNYCCKEHRKKDMVTHNEVCEELLQIRKDSEKIFDIQTLPKIDALVLLVLKPKGPEGQQMVSRMKMLDLPPDIKNTMDYLKGVQDGNLIPLYKLAKFNPITKTQQKKLNTWSDLFTILDKITVTPGVRTDLDKLIGHNTAVEAGNRDIELALTRILTDSMTVFSMMKDVNLLDNCEEDKVIRLHVIGAEPSEEIVTMHIFFNVLSSISRCTLRIVFIGPLLLFPPGQVPVQMLYPAITFFQGTYQDYILTSDYEKPDCIVAFFPGLYDGTYNWLPAVVQAVAKKIPFLVTCCSKEDHCKTKEWLMNGTHMKPEIVQDYLNPFGSRQAIQEVSGSNSVSKRNMFSLLLIGGDLGALRPLLKVEDENVEHMQVLFKSMGKNSLSDIMNLKKSGKI